jgi:hypothetical protein
MSPFSNRLKILKKPTEPPMSADNPNEPSGMKVVELWRRRNAENTKVIWNNSDNNIVAEKLWSERRRGENFETRNGKHKRGI